MIQSEKDFVEIKNSKNIVLRAINRWNAMPKEGKFSRIFTESPEKTLLGFVAEEAIFETMPKMTRSSDIEVYDWDFLLFGRRIEVKNKTCNSVTRINHDGSVYAYNLQKCDRFIFTRTRQMNNSFLLPKGKEQFNKSIVDFENISNALLEKYPTVLLCGYISSDDFKKNMFDVPRGTQLGGGKLADGHTLNILYEKCTSLNILLKCYQDRYNT